ncbi:MAG: 5-oxoprolinase subunit PxpB [Parahaliea sp.]
MRLTQAGEGALILYLGNETNPIISNKVQLACNIIETVLGNNLIDLIPSYASLLIIYDPLRCDHFHVRTRILQALQNMPAVSENNSRKVCLPVYYAPEAGADLEALAKHAGLSVDEVIAIHSETEYRVYAIGFAPGFAYLGQVDERIAAPRLATPRQRVPRGAVAIADRQTAVYPAASPGGWNLIGLCPTRLFNAQAQPTMPIAVGDRVYFEPVCRQRYLELGGEEPKNEQLP